MLQNPHPASRTLSVLAVLPETGEIQELAGRLVADGHRVTTVEDGAEAVRMILDEAPDAVVVDLALPGRDGYELTRTLCYLLKVRPLLVALSDVSGLDERCWAEGFDLVLEKPVNLDELAKVLGARSVPVTTNGAVEAKREWTEERRGSARRTPRGTVRVSCYRGPRQLGVNIARVIVDLSETGIRLLVKGSLEPGQEVFVGVEGEGHLRPVRRTGKVEWCSPTECGFYIGVQFHSPLDVADVFILT